MNISNDSPPRRRAPTPARRRIQLLAAFERSGLSAAAFARQQGIHYTTFCAWRYRRAQSQPTPAFVEVDLAESSGASELVIEVGAQARLRLTSAAQLELAARFLHHLNALALC